MKRIPLTQGQFAIVDDRDYDGLNKHKWCADWCTGGQSFYAIMHSPVDMNSKQKITLMHRMIMNAPHGDLVDHWNHNTLDNRRENLRVCSASENNSNQRRRVDNTSGFKGVGWDKWANKWRARVHVNGRPIYTGYHHTALDAALAYDSAALKYYGEFALTNKMLGLLPTP